MCVYTQVPYRGAAVSHFFDSSNKGVFMVGAPFTTLIQSATALTASAEGERERRPTQALRRLFLLRNLFSNQFSYYSYLATTMEDDLSDMLQMDWKNWLLATLAISLKSATVDSYVPPPPLAPCEPLVDAPDPRYGAPQPGKAKHKQFWLLLITCRVAEPTHSWPVRWGRHRPQLKPENHVRVCEIRLWWKHQR